MLGMVTSVATKATSRARTSDTNGNYLQIQQRERDEGGGRGSASIGESGKHAGRLAQSGARTRVPYSSIKIVQ